jgi:hypothetical protein
VKYFILFFSLIFLYVPVVQADEFKFGDGVWNGYFDKKGNKNLVGHSKSGNVALSIYVDEQLITRLQFEPTRPIRVAKFDHKQFRGMNFQSLYGYDHWIRRMIKHYNMQVWFKGDKNPEVFSLKGFSKGIRWLQSR